MKVSVIVPVYNAEKYIERCARSLFEQTYQDIEYIFVNDCSIDDSINVLLNVIAEYPAVRERCMILHNEVNCGCAQTREKGIRASTGEYMIHVDSDDYVDRCFIEKLANEAQSCNADMVMCGLVYDYGSKQEKHIFPDVSSSEDCLSKVLSGVIHGSLCNKLVRSSIIKMYNIYFTDGIILGEDKFIIIRALYYCKVVSVIDEALYIYNKTNDYSVTSRLMSTHNASVIELVRQTVEFFATKNISDVIKASIRSYKVVALGHVLLYGKVYPDVEERKLFSDITFRDIIKQPVVPVYYKLSCALHKCKLNFVIFLFHAVISMKGRR